MVHEILKCGVGAGRELNINTEIDLLLLQTPAIKSAYLDVDVLAAIEWLTCESSL
jgi:hypothetical protein